VLDLAESQHGFAHVFEIVTLPTVPALPPTLTQSTPAIFILPAASGLTPFIVVIGSPSWFFIVYTAYYIDIIPE
jgi:hypothetical protein